MGLPKYLPSYFKNFIQLHVIGPVIGLPNKYYSQAGEDIILLQILRVFKLFKNKGFFVDVGAYHPYVGSNTFALYQMGWRGINIDARPGSMIPFNKYRPEDINLEIGISKECSILNYYMFNEGATMNSFSKEFLENIGMFKNVDQTIQVQTYPLKDILSRHETIATNFDYLNIDAEGLDLEIIKSNDFTKFRPKIISVEVGSLETMNDILENNVYTLLVSLGYVLVAKNIIVKSVGTLFFVDRVIFDS